MHRDTESLKGENEQIVMGKTWGSQAGDLRKTVNDEKAQKGKSPQRHYLGYPYNPPRIRVGNSIPLRVGNRSHESQNSKCSQQTTAARTKLLPDQFCPRHSQAYFTRYLRPQE